MPAPVILAGISEAFDATDIECLVRAAAEAVCGDLDDLSSLQHELAQRAYRLVQAENTAYPTESVDDDLAAPVAVYPVGSTAHPDVVRLRDSETHVDNEAHAGDPSGPVVRALLDLSTAHLTEATCRELNSYDGVTAYETTHGWLMYVPADAEQRTADGDWPPELQPIVSLAHIHGCDYILFDQDAPQSDHTRIHHHRYQRPRAWSLHRHRNTHQQPPEPRPLHRHNHDRPHPVTDTSRRPVRIAGFGRCAEIHIVDKADIGLVADTRCGEPGPHAFRPQCVGVH